ncbi:TauD/TfdA family dioxygenase [Humitalea sp. 24SJ18S-53]|uniref:TauD/TfdA family dioxygenase n=1 Tax=Humitalea sp. 24SJ18S-53 TaxID=3422307 RepID=UPI003D673F84
MNAPVNVPSPTLVDGFSVWTGPQMAGQSGWVHHLDPATLAEIEAAVRVLRARGASLEAVGAADFPLPSLAATLPAMRQEITEGRGFVMIRGLPRERYSDDELGMIFWGIGTHFGVGLPQSWIGEKLGHVIDLSDEEAEPRAYHNGGHIGMHTDSCDIVALLCLRPAKSGGASRLASAHAVHNMLLAEDAALLAPLYEGFPYRSTNADAKGADRAALTPYKVPVFLRNQGALEVYYIRGYIRRAVAAGDVVLSAEQIAALDRMDKIAMSPDVYLDMDFQPGDMQFVNNRKIFHGRTDYEDFPEKERRRHLLRLWLKVPEWAPMHSTQTTHSEEEKWRWAENMKKREHAAKG